MPVRVPSVPLRLSTEPLTAEAFAPFGTVISNPLSSTPTSNSPVPVTANQGTALKYEDVSRMTDFYHLAPSKKHSRPVMNIFVCSPRKLRPDPSSSSSSSAGVFDVGILERHPYTSQTFIPLGVSPNDPSTSYLVIVAPTLPVAATRDQRRPPPFPLPEPGLKRSLQSIFSTARPSPFTNEAAVPSTSSSSRASLVKAAMMRGPGLPDLSRMRAFVARGDQAVTYAAGTWHAPMVVLGVREVCFVVAQNTNGVGIEDCQEVEFDTHARNGEGCEVVMAEDPLGSMKAKF